MTKDPDAITADAGATNKDERDDGPTIWEDPTVPIGNGPFTDRWPIAAWAAVWLVWLAFLAGMLATPSGAASGP